VTTQRGEDPATADQPWYTHPVPRTPADDAPSTPAVPAVQAVVQGAGAPWSPPAEVGSTRAERRRARESSTDDTGPIERVVDAPAGSDGRMSETGPVERVGDSGGELYGALRDSADRREGGGATAAEPRRGRRRVADEPVPVEESFDGFDPGDTGTWKVRDVVPGADGGRRHTTILRYLLGLLAVDHVRALTRWTFAVPVVGLVLLLIKPRWIGLAVFVLGLLLIVGRVLAVRMIERRTLPRRYRPVEDDLRAAVEAGKANLRGELRRVGMPSSALALSRSAVRSGSSDSRSDDRSRLRDIEIDRVLPRAQLDRALRVLDGATAGR
jgi:uncharacterized membrane protein YecN with MAPEG domain